MDTKQDIRALYPQLDEDEIQQAEDNLEQYLLLVLRIYERIHSDPESHAQFRNLTGNVGTLACTSPRSDRLPDQNSDDKT